VLTLTPYTAQLWHEIGVYFASHGLPFVAVDCRGRGNAEGAFRPFLQEAQDGYDVVEWVARQPYCNGKVGMWGGSYAGYDQWATASQCPPHLSTIVPVASVYPGLDFPMRNNVFYPYVMQWLTFVSGRTLQDRMFWGAETFWAKQFLEWFESGTSFKNLDTMLGNPSVTFQEWVSHPQRDAYWDGHNPTSEQRARICLPILTITGVYDADQPGALMHYREHMEQASVDCRAPHYLVIGPWDHAGTRTPRQQFAGMRFGPASLVDLRQLHVQWYAWIMQDGPKPAFLQRDVAYYVTGAEKWRYADSLDAITLERRPLYLDSNGSASGVFASGVLRGEVGNGREDVYVYDPRDTSIAALEVISTDPLCTRPTFPTDNLADQKPIFALEGKQLIYHCATFERDTEISGFFKLTAWISIDRPDTDFRVAVYEVDASGASVLLTSDSMRARYRESLREEELIRTQEPLRYDFDRFTFASRLLRKGSRLRVVIGPINSIYSQKNHNSGGVVSEESMADASPVTVKLYHNLEHPSTLYVPFGRPEVAGEPEAPLSCFSPVASLGETA
jgi:putative CocE/NonD family hydrolase